MSSEIRFRLGDATQSQVEALADHLCLDTKAVIKMAVGRLHKDLLGGGVVAPPKATSQGGPAKAPISAPLKPTPASNWRPFEMIEYEGRYGPVDANGCVVFWDEETATRAAADHGWWCWQDMRAAADMGARQVGGVGWVIGMPDTYYAQIGKEPPPVPPELPPVVR